MAASTPETFHIVEVSSFQLETIETFHPWIAVLLNLSSDHLDRHGSMEAYGAAKARIFANQTRDDLAVINADDPQTLAMARAGRARKVSFLGRHAARAAVVDSADRPAPGRRRDGRRDGGADSRACRPTRWCGRSSRSPGLEHALEPVAVDRRRPVRQRLEGDQRRGRAARHRELRAGLVVIMGGPLQERRFLAASRAAAARDAKVVAIGEATPLIRDERSTERVPVEAAGTLEAAVRRAYELARAKGRRAAVLLAPACASFDMFRDYAERGRVFKKEVLRLAEETTRASSEQSSVGWCGRELAAGNTGCPGL